MESVYDEMQQIANSYGVIPVLGIRPDGPWFANCIVDNKIIEFDASTPAEAVSAVRKKLREETVSKIRNARFELEKAEAALRADALPDPKRELPLLESYKLTNLLDDVRDG